jgi:branched-chain amino acid transport system ATP-binding protein
VKRMLKIEGLSAWYGEAQVLRGLDLEVQEGQVATLVGRNGAGKTTTLRCLMGLHKQIEGRMTLDGQDLGGLPSHRRAGLGLGFVPDDRGIYASLSVEENLLLPPKVGPDAWSLDRVYQMFPRLKDRRKSAGSKLSGGEQQMLAIARVLRMGARLLLLDEPTEGLAPVLVQQIGAIIDDVKQHGVTILLIEQNLRFATRVAERHHLLAQGRIVESLTNEEVKARERELLTHLGV